MPMIVAPTNSRLAKIERSSWTNEPPKSACPGSIRQVRPSSTQKPTTATTPTARRSSDRLNTPAKNTTTMRRPSATSATRGLPIGGIRRRLPDPASSEHSEAIEQRHRRRVHGVERDARQDPEQHDDEDEDRERRPLGSSRVGQALEVRIGRGRPPEDLLRHAQHV